MTHPTSVRAAQNTKAAIVVGVDHAGGLPVLGAAASGAKDMAAWLSQKQQYDVQLFVDDKGPVTAAPIFDAINNIVKRGTYTRLLVFFAGHGCLNLRADFWLLSGAPENPNEAINVDASAWSARLASIPNVVFVSDCCRSLANDVGLASINGFNIFPSGNRLAHSSALVDRFHATRIGDAAFEGTIEAGAKAYKGVYTQCFLNAFEDPPADFLSTVGTDYVVPDRQLQRFLETEVPKRAQALSIELRQFPDAIITSPDMTYLGRVFGKPKPAKTAAAAPTTKDLSAVVVSSIVTDTSATLSPELFKLGRDSGYFDTQQAVIRADDDQRSVGGQTGFVVTNFGVKQVALTSGAKASVTAGDPATSITIDIERPHPVSALIQFADGSGTVAAVIPGYVATIVVEKGVVVGINYLPSPKGGRPIYGDATRRRLRRLRANAAAAARLGAFRADTPEAAARLGDSIRMLKGIDPTLGLYAAYAYTQAGRFDQVRSVASAMRGYIGLLIFDVAMLGALEAPDTAAHGGPISPFCPMLSQGWTYLAATGTVIPAVAMEASRYLRRQALWTTFDPKGVATLLDSPLFNGG